MAGDTPGLIAARELAAGLAVALAFGARLAPGLVPALVVAPDEAAGLAAEPAPALDEAAGAADTVTDGATVWSGAGVGFALRMPLCPSSAA